MIVIQAIAIIVGYIIISTAVTILFVYLDRKAGYTAQEVYKEDNFYGNCVVGFLFPLSLPCIVIAEICEFIKIIVETKIAKFIKIMCVAIVETKIAIEKSEDE